MQMLRNRDSECGSNGSSQLIARDNRTHGITNRQVRFHVKIESVARLVCRAPESQDQTIL